MNIRPARTEDLSSALEIYKIAREFMLNNGNPEQWGEVYPPDDLVEFDIENERLYILEENGAIEGVFAFFKNGDPLYDDIDGKWLNSEPYVAVHRVASAGRVKGIFSAILDFCASYSNNVKIDTYKENSVMLHILAKNQFVKCGTVICEDMPFIVFQKIFSK